MLEDDAEPTLMALDAAGHAVRAAPTGSMALSFRIDDQGVLNGLPRRLRALV